MFISVDLPEPDAPMIADEFTGTDIKRNAVQDFHRKIAIVKCLADILKPDEWSAGHEGAHQKKRILGLRPRSPPAAPLPVAGGDNHAIAFLKPALDLASTRLRTPTLTGRSTRYRFLVGHLDGDLRLAAFLLVSKGCLGTTEHVLRLTQSEIDLRTHVDHHLPVGFRRRTDNRRTTLLVCRRCRLIWRSVPVKRLRRAGQAA